MNLGDLKAPRGATHRKKRLGRGIGSGHGKTSSRGHQGQGSRTSGTVRPGFEGGQMPLYRRVPKFGFKNPFRVEYQPVNVRELDARAEKGKDGVIGPKLLAEAGLIHSAEKPVKILADGEVKSKVTVKAEAFSEGAKKKIEAAGGKAELIVHTVNPPPPRGSSKADRKQPA